MAEIVNDVPDSWLALPMPRSYAPGRIAIYGIFENGVCQYVGQTQCPKNRMKGHSSHIGKFHLKDVQMRVFRWVKPQDANRIEKQVDSAFKRRAQACLSVREPAHTRTKYGKRKIWVEGVGNPFPSAHHVGITVGSSALSVENALQSDGFIKDRLGHTLCIMEEK